MFLFLVFANIISFAQDYPFQDTRLSEDERIKNELSQMWDPELLKQVADWEATECRYLAQSPAGRLVQSWYHPSISYLQCLIMT